MSMSDGNNYTEEAKLNRVLVLQNFYSKRIQLTYQKIGITTRMSLCYQNH